MGRNKGKRIPKGRLKEKIAKTRTFRNAKGIVAMPPLEYTIQLIEAMDQLPMEIRMRPEMRYRGYDNHRMGFAK